MNKYKLTYLLLVSVVLIFSCNPARHLQNGQFLLAKNTIKCNNSDVDLYELESYIKQKPNKKQAYTYIRLRIYNTFNHGKSNRVKRWFKKTLGDEPVIFDSILAINSCTQIKLYLNNKGFFNSSVKYSFKGKKERKKAAIVYTVNTTPPYIIKNINYSINDPTLKAFIYSDKSNSLIQKGQQFDSDILSEERDRITANLNNYGYYYFSKEFIRFNIDTSFNNHELEITTEILNPSIPSPDNPDSLINSTHKRYYINNIYITVDYNTAAKDTIKYDTTRISVPGRRKEDMPKTYYIIYHDELNIKPKILTQQIFIDSGDYYRFNDIEKTYKHLYNLKIFRYVNIIFEEIKTGSGKTDLLNCRILLSRLPLQAFAIEGVATNRGGDLGVSTSLVYENRNFLNGGELFNIKLNGALEVKKISISSNSDERVLGNLPFFNTVEAGVESNLKVPKFLIPIRQEKFSKNFRPKTNINAGFNYQQRPDFTRYILKSTLSYEWKESATKTHIISPIEVNSVSIFPDSLFEARIKAMEDRIAQYAYQDHIITSLKYSFIYNNQNFEKKQNFTYFRGNFEIAGFVFWLYSNTLGHPGSYSLMDIPYSQYCRVDFDYKYYMLLNDKNSVVTRMALGVGVPLNQYNTLPFEKSFYLGGSNSMRGWRIRTIGPGAYIEPDTVSSSFDRIGEISLESNFEYRFPIYKYFQGAFFIDAGNVWLRTENSSYPGGEFKFDRFYSEIAIDAGLGLRLDLDFFLFRFDCAIPLKDPELPAGNRWIYQNNNKFSILGNLGIGYPF